MPTFFALISAAIVLCHAREGGHLLLIRHPERRSLEDNLCPTQSLLALAVIPALCRDHLTQY
jgi:hypothetical protein